MTGSKEYSDELLTSKVRTFINTKRMINAEMRRIIKNNIALSFDAIIDYCMRKAWSDAMIRERMDPASRAVKNKAVILSFFKKEITESAVFYDNYNSWHISTCSSTFCGMRYGLWQKLINMTFKYLFCFKDIPTVKAVRIPWREMHCPVDSVIAVTVLDLMRHYGIPDRDGIIKSISDNGLYGVSWNNISREQYLYVQKTVSELCELNSIPSKLCFDFVFWARRNA